jgi:hypothetical protein
MPKLQKDILPKGRYLVSTSTGKRVFQEFDETYLSTIAENTNKMIESGLRIPAPYQHVKEAVPVTEEISSDAYNNSGYWSKLWMKDGVLCGEIDCDGDISDSNTNAGKLKNTVKEVSACIRKSWEDGRGQKWGPCMLHGAAVLHPVVAGQNEFEIAEESIALSISGMETDESMEADVTELSSELEKIGVFLPKQTTPKDLIKVLTISVRQLNMVKNSADSDEEFVEPRSVFLSTTGVPTVTLTPEAANEIVKLGLIDPNTKQPVTLEGLPVQEDPMKAVNLSLVNIIKEERKDAIKSRVEKLVEAEVIDQEYAESEFYADLEQYELSIKDGKVAQTAIERSLNTIEKMASKMGKTKTEGDDKEKLEESLLSSSGNDEVLHKPPKESSLLSGEELDGAINALLAD